MIPNMLPNTFLGRIIVLVFGILAVSLTLVEGKSVVYFVIGMTLLMIGGWEIYDIDVRKAAKESGG